MKTVNMHEAKTHLSRLVEAAARGEPFVIARAGKPMVKVVPLDDEPDVSRRIGIAKGKFEMPDSIDGANDEIARMFGVDPA
jgi:prevent-host-death family protein